MNVSKFRKYLDRDQGCLHCGDRETAVPHHRANRGMGGSKEFDVPSNIMCLCSAMNGLIESDADLAALARQYGWKLSRYEKPAQTPVYDLQKGIWVLLDDNFGRKNVKRGDL